MSPSHALVAESCVALWSIHDCGPRRCSLAGRVALAQRCPGQPAVTSDFPAFGRRCAAARRRRAILQACAGRSIREYGGACRTSPWTAHDFGRPTCSTIRRSTDVLLTAHLWLPPPRGPARSRPDNWLAIGDMRGFFPRACCDRRCVRAGGPPSLSATRVFGLVYELPERPPARPGYSCVGLLVCSFPSCSGQGGGQRAFP